MGIYRNNDKIKLILKNFLETIKGKFVEKSKFVVFCASNVLRRIKLLK
jgi:hypothetical protein